MHQESAWFDIVSYTELSAKIAKESQAIELALGDKAGQITFSISMSLSGFMVGFFKGWSLALAILAIAPALIFVAMLFGKVQEAGSKKSQLAFAQSAGYAEQALSAVRVVVAFGQEMTEKENFNGYLERAKKAGMKIEIFAALSIALFFLVIYVSYGYAFWISSVFIENEI